MDSYLCLALSLSAEPRRRISRQQKVSSLQNHTSYLILAFTVRCCSQRVFTRENAGGAVLERLERANAYATQWRRREVRAM